MVLKVSTGIFKINAIIESIDATMIITYFNLKLREVVFYLVLTCGAHHTSLHLGSKIGAIKVGRPRGRAGQDALKNTEKGQKQGGETRRESREKSTKLKKGDAQSRWGLSERLTPGDKEAGMDNVQK